MRWIAFAVVCSATVAAASVTFLMNGTAAASPAKLGHLQRPSALQPPVGALLGILSSPSTRLPPKESAAAVLAILKQYPKSDAAWTRETSTLFRGCSIGRGVPARVVSEECHVGGCAFVLETDTKAEQEQIARAASQKPACAGRHGHLELAAWEEGGKVHALFVYLAPYTQAAPRFRPF